MRTTFVRLAAGGLTCLMLSLPATASADALSRANSAAASSSSNGPRSFSGKLGSLHIYSGTKFSTPTATSADGKQSSTSGRSWGARWVRWNSRRPNADGTVKEKNLTLTRAKTVTTEAAPSEKKETRTFWARGAAPDKFENKREGSPTKTVISTAVTPTGNVESASEHHNSETGKTTGVRTTFDTTKRIETRVTTTNAGRVTGISSR